MSSDPRNESRPEEIMGTERGNTEAAQVRVTDPNRSLKYVPFVIIWVPMALLGCHSKDKGTTEKKDRHSIYESRKEHIGWRLSIRAAQPIGKPRGLLDTKPVTNVDIKSLGNEVTTFERSEVVDIEFAVTNDNKKARPLLIRRNDPWMGFQIEVRHPDGKPAALTPCGEDVSYYNVFVRPRFCMTFSPQKSLWRLLPEINRLYDMSVSGKYTLKIRRKFSFADNMEEFVDLTSNTITVEITEY